MEFQIGQQVKINDILLNVSAIADNYALAIDISKGIVDGGYIPVMLKLNDDKSQIQIVTDVDEVKVALEAIITNKK